MQSGKYFCDFFQVLLKIFQAKFNESESGSNNYSVTRRSRSEWMMVSIDLTDVTLVCDDPKGDLYW